MRVIQASEISSAVAKMCIDANCNLNQDIVGAISRLSKAEQSPTGREMLDWTLKNADIAKQKQVPICQDTGMAVFRVRIGQDVHIQGGLLNDAINEGVREGYTDGFLRKSVVADPLRRENTADNTPAVIYTELVPGDRLTIEFAPKGFGSENMSALAMLKPAQGIEGVIDFIIKTVDSAGPNACPPMVVGVGIGGTMDKAAQLAKFALMRPVGTHNPDPFYAELEKTLLEKINGLGIGPQGLGGTTTAIGVNVEVFATHIAGLPVAVNISCHATRHAKIIL